MKKLFVLAAAMCLLATSAYAAEWNFYGSARVLTQFSSTETPPANTDVDTLQHGLAGNARIGANVKASDSLIGRFEYGTGSSGPTGVTNAAVIRLLYGEWNFGAGKLLVGQDYTPVFNITGNQIFSPAVGTSDDVNMLMFGTAYSGREGQVKLKFGNFQIAMLAPGTAYNSTTVNADANAVVVSSLNTEATVPAFEASYRFAMDNWWFVANGGYQTFDVRTGAGTNWLDVDSYILAANAGITFGPVTLSGTVNVGQNSGNLITTRTAGAAGNAGNGKGLAALQSGIVYDNETFGLGLVGQFKANDMFTIEAGYGYAENEYDIAGSQEDDVATYYIQTTITLAPGVMITPEIGVVDFKQSGQDEITYIGARWQLNF